MPLVWAAGVLTNGHGNNYVEDVVRDLERRARHLQRVVDPETETNAALRAAFKRLNIWGAQVTYPVILHLLDLEDRTVATLGEVTSAVATIESFLVRRMICGVPTNNLNRIFNSLVSQLRSDQSVDSAVREVLSRERNFWPDNSMLRTAMRTRPFYWQGRASQRQLVLRRLEESYLSAERGDLDGVQLTIEHVLPQSPTMEWLDTLREEVAPGQRPEDLHRELVHTIGNLTLTGYNSQLSNNPFQRTRDLLDDSACKQDLFRNSNLELNRRIAATPRWGQAEILRRADELAIQASSIWPEPLTPIRTTNGRDWTVLDKVLAEIPAGAWTTTGELAVLIGTRAASVDAHLSTVSLTNAHRVLTPEGRISAMFHSIHPSDSHNPVDILRAEGVVFDADGTADPNQRLSAADLAVWLAWKLPNRIPPIQTPKTWTSDTADSWIRLASFTDPQSLAWSTGFSMTGPAWVAPWISARGARQVVTYC
jgi:alkylated DNA nucleotide flippase Atl1